MMPSATDWRSVTQYQYLTRLDRPGFGWEFLRRNVAYQEDYSTFAREAASDANSEARSTESLRRKYSGARTFWPRLFRSFQRASRARAHSQ